MNSNNVFNSAKHPDPANHLWLSLLVAANNIKSASAELFRRHAITAIQYNVLRILYGAGEEGRTCGEIGGRMIDRDPDITRLLNRLIKEGYVSRWRPPEDRRSVRSKLTEAGVKLVEDIAEPLDSLQNDLFSDIPEAIRDRLIQDLDTLPAATNKRNAAIK